MHVLLINPYVAQMHRELSYAENFRPPLGLAYCAAVLERAGHRVEIVDALAHQASARLKRLGYHNAEVRAGDAQTLASLRALLLAEGLV